MSALCGAGSVPRVVLTRVCWPVRWDRDGDTLLFPAPWTGRRVYSEATDSDLGMLILLAGEAPESCPWHSISEEDADTGSTVRGACQVEEQQVQRPCGRNRLGSFENRRRTCEIRL